MPPPRLALLGDFITKGSETLRSPPLQVFCAQFWTVSFICVRNMVNGDNCRRVGGERGIARSELTGCMGGVIPDTDIISRSAIACVLVTSLPALLYVETSRDPAVSADTRRESYRIGFGLFVACRAGRSSTTVNYFLVVRRKIVSPAMTGAMFGVFCVEDACLRRFACGKSSGVGHHRLFE